MLRLQETKQFIHSLWNKRIKYNPVLCVLIKKQQQIESHDSLTCVWKKVEFYDKEIKGKIILFAFCIHISFCLQLCN